MKTHVTAVLNYHTLALICEVQTSSQKKGFVSLQFTLANVQFNMVAILVLIIN